MLFLSLTTNLGSPVIINASQITEMYVANPGTYIYVVSSDENPIHVKELLEEILAMIPPSLC